MSGVATLCEQQREKIVDQAMPFIRYTAYRLARRLPPQLSVNDLVHVGVIGLLDALERYNDGQSRLQTFVEYRIKGAMLDELRYQDWTPRSVRDKIGRIRKAGEQLGQELGRTPREEEIAGSLGMDIDEYRRTLQNADKALVVSFDDFASRLQNEGGRDVAECIADPDARTPLELLELVRDRESLFRCITALPRKEQHVLSLYYWEELTMKEIGRVMGLSEGRICQIHHHALTALRGLMVASAHMQ